MSLEAALRDTGHDQSRVRGPAVASLAPALLEATGESAPSKDAVSLDPRGDAVVGALKAVATGDDDARLRGVALLGLGQLGRPEAIAIGQAWFLLDEESSELDPDAFGFLRECAAIAMSFVGRCGPPGDPTRVEVRTILVEGLHGERPEVRFQAAMGLAELGDPQDERALTEALEAEEHELVRENILAALALFETLSEPSLEALRSVVRDETDDELEGPAGFAAALGLAAARDPAAGPRLVDAMAIKHERDRALEALAVLGPSAPKDAADELESITRRGLTVPPITRVRAAYALARIDPERGEARLERFARHPKKMVREAVAEAREALRLLAP